MTEENTQVVYDASANQRVPGMTEFGGELYEIAYIFGPPDFDTLKEFDLRKNVRLSEAEPDETTQRSGTVTESDLFSAQVWLFDEKAISVEGVGEPGAEPPANWKDFFSDQEKADAIREGYLICEVVELPRNKAGKFLPWKHQEDTRTVRLRTLVNGQQLVTEHVLRNPDTQIMETYNSVMSRAVLVQGSKIGKGDTYIPTRWAKLGQLYDQLKVSATGYAGQIPLHHRAEIVMYHCGEAQKFQIKNSNGSPESLKAELPNSTRPSNQAAEATDAPEQQDATVTEAQPTP